MRALAKLIAAIVSAALYGLAFPPAPWRTVAWVALVPLMMALRGGATGSALATTWVWTVALGCVVNGWFPTTVAAYFGQPLTIGFVLFLGVCTFTCGLQTMVFAIAYRRITAHAGVIVPLLVAAAWVTADMLRLLTFGGDPWALLGYSQVGILPLMQIADVTGVHGITFIVVAVNAAIAEVLWVRGRSDRSRVVAGLAVAVLLVAATAGYGARRLGMPLEPAGAPAVVGIVQADLPLGSQWRRSFYGRNLETYLRLSVDVLRSARPALLVWPENAMTFFVDTEPAYRASIANVLTPFGTELVAGGPLAETPDEPPFRNSAFLLGADGQIRGRYDKQILLPFAEYFPLGRLDILRRNFGRVREFVPGDEVALLDTAIGRVGVVICNEGFFSAPAAARVRSGATVLVNLANDSWLNEPRYSEPAFDMVRLRAVEQRRWIIRASTAGPSAVVDPFGRVVERTPLFTSTTSVGTVTPLDVVTPYNRAGDTFAWSCVATTLVVWFWRRAPRGAPKSST